MPAEPSSPAAELQRRLAESRPDPGAIAGLLDGLDSEARIAATRSLGRAEQRALYRAVEGFRPVTLADLVPASAGDFATVRHFGRNTLPAFSLFEKRFTRPPGEDGEKPGQLFGFNFQSMQPVTGPGYFIARQDTQRPEVLVDYTRVPETHPDDWPEIRSNERGLSRFVYGFMLDTLRGVTAHVTIGSAARKGRDMGSWFVLCREA
jgi:hypothetical protein